MASSDLKQYGRGSARLGEKRSREETDNEGAEKVAEEKQPAQNKASTKRLPRKKGSGGARAATRVSVIQPVMGSMEAEPAGKTTESTKADCKGVVSRAKGAKGGVLKSTPKPRQRKIAPEAATIRQQPQRSRAKSTVNAPSSTGVKTTSEPPCPLAMVDSSRESSPLSDIPDNFSLEEAPSFAPIQSGLFTQMPPVEAPRTDTPLESQMSGINRTVLTSDTEAAADESGNMSPRRDTEDMETPGSPAGKNIIVEKRRYTARGEGPAVLEPVVAASESAIGQISTEQLSASINTVVETLTGKEVSMAPEILQTVQDEQAAAAAVVKQKRQRRAPQRLGARENVVAEPEVTDPVISDPIGDESEIDYGESSRKRRKTSATKAKAPRTPAKRVRTSEKVKAVAKRRAGRPRQQANSEESDVMDSVPTKIVTLAVRFDPSIRVDPETPPPMKTTPKATPKQPRKPAPRKTLKTALQPALPPAPDSIAVEPVRPELAVDPEKLEISRRLTIREPLGSKPPPQGEPAVWAESRQALCETSPYFKRPQGGCYQNDSHVYGFLFDSVGHCREYLDEDIIICRAGGSMEQDPSGGMAQKKDQSMKEAQVQAIMNDIAHQNPHVVICGNRNGGAICEMPHQYSVLGWYKPVAVWAERTAGKGKKIWTTIKYRLERLDQAGEPVPWHAPAGSDLASLRLTADPVLWQQCEDCGKTFDQVYLQGWMCLNAACEAFWKINGFSAPSGSAGLDYNPDFLLSRAPVWGDERPPAPVRPPIPDVGNIIGDNLAYINTRGICCPKCGRCNSRRLFDRWVCENPSCDFELRPQHRPVMPTHLHTPWDAAPTLVRNKVEAGVYLKVEHKYGYKVCTYTFDGIDGCFIHAAATKASLAATDGPDEMMANLQSEDLGLERRVFAGTKMSGGKKADAPLVALPSPPREQQDPIAAGEDEDPAKAKRTFEEGDLMTAFSMNYGMPYKFVASGASRSFETAPKAVNDCRYRLNWAARTLLGKSKDDLDFNEELIFTYLEGQKIEYHDDGEDGLGPEIACLSLGGRAKMYMRMKAKHFVGCSKTGILTEEKPVPGSIDGDAMYRKRLAAWQELQTLKSNSATYNRRRRELPKELGLFEKRMKKADDLVTVTLSHGDIMVMDGYDIQRYLEHKVVPEGYLRFALTCRTVLEEHLRPEERPGYVVLPDEGTYDGAVGF